MANTPKPKPQEPTDLPARRRIKDFVENQKDAKARRFEFRAGQILVREGDALKDMPALLIIEGACEEKTYCFVPGQGHVPQTVKRVMEGQIANVQALVPVFCDRPALCSVHAVVDGYALKLDAASIRSLREVGWLLTEEFRHQIELLEVLGRMNALYGGLSSMLDEIRTRRPDMPCDPAAVVQGLLDSLHRIQELQNELREKQHDMDAADHEMNELTTTLEESEFVIKSQEAQLARQGAEIERLTAESVGLASQNQTFQGYYQKLESMVEERDQKLIGLKAENKRLTSTNATLESACGNLRKRVEALTAPTDKGRVYAPDDERLAYRVLTQESENAREATQTAEQARREAHAARQRAEEHLVRMQRAIELLSRLNPDIIFPSEVLMLLMGEEPDQEPDQGPQPEPTDDVVDDAIDQLFEEAKDSFPPSPLLPKPETK